MNVAPLPQPEAIIFYDGECGFCNRWVVFVLRHDLDGKFQFAALNSQTARTRIQDASLLNGSTVILLTPEAIFTRSTAVLKIAAQLPGYKILASLLLKIPRTLRDRIYAFIARHRHTFQPSQSPTCAFIPGVENRFLP